ncbi:MAG: hypothetical protein KAJ33_08970, partial [Thermoplasmata archaeon]|nr:hypothetical protein [Thermoplasmata archaeon]
MKWRVISIVSMLIISALFVGAGSTLAAPFTGTVTLRDSWNGNVQDYFEPSDDIYFYVTVLDDGAPLQSQWVNVTIVGDGIIGEVFNLSYQTDSFGQFIGDDWDDFWTVHDIGDYTLYVKYLDQEIVIKTFKIYEPVAWDATGWITYYGILTDEFTEDQVVDVRVQAFDQFGNPFDGFYGDVWYEIEHNGWVVDTEYLSTNNTGEDAEYYYPEYQYSNQFGVYTVTVYNDAIPARTLDTFSFTVVLPNRAVVWPQYFGENRTVFTEGEHVGYEVQLFYQDTIPYDSESYAARILLFHESDMINPIRNDSLRTDWDGTDTEWNYYNIGFGESFKGVYYLRAYNYAGDIVGTGIFMVIDLDIELLPYKGVYSQGDDVTLGISTSLEEAYTVKITDHSHDELSGASWNVPAGTSEWLKEFTFPDIDDGTYHVDVYMGDLLIGSHTFELKKFTIEARLSQGAFLPGQSGTLFWRAVNNHDGGPITISADTEMAYYDNDWDYETDTLDDLTGSAGNFGFTVPKDAMIGSPCSINIDAEDSSEHTDYASVPFQVGSLYVTVSKDRSSYRPGDSVYMTFTSTVGGGSIVPNVDIRARAQYDGSTVGDTWTVTTDGGGQATFVYQIPSGAEDGLYMIVMNATFDSNRDIMFNGTSDFTVTNDPVISMILYQEISFFSPGDTVNIPYRVLK